VSLGAGTWTIIGDFDVLVNNALNDRAFEGHLDVNGVDQTQHAILDALGLVNDRWPIPQVWVVTLASSYTVKLRTKHSGGTVGDFTVKQTSSNIVAFQGADAAPSSSWAALVYAQHQFS